MSRVSVCRVAAALVFFAVSAIPSAASHYYYTGSVGSMPIQMDLSVQGKNVTGTYYYNKVGDVLTLKGVRTGANTASVKEYNSGGQSTGTFTGKLSPSYNAWSGSWTSADKSRKFPFNVKAVAGYVKEKGKTNSIVTTATYPHFMGNTKAISQLNQNIKADYMRRRSADIKTVNELDLPEFIKKRGLYLGYNADVAYASPDLVSVVAVAEDYLGGAHGMNYHTTGSYRLTDSGIQVLNLDSLLKPGYETVLSQTVIDKLKAKGAAWVTSGEITEFKKKDLQTFTVTPKGLTFYFDPYAVGPYAQGPFAATVPYSTIRDYIRPNGLLDRFTD